ncbi:putative WRKY transcription factor 57 [Raphanus sativus]|uniref:Probable WRKY transcription factor 57 n=1 Tax=Raphanus sativus TaxID=3726 RepID=A0A6J0K3N6_RAPSA|nr:probable WRKY transcription factor 57 [Raphanus sativus]XP_056858205.1 probable WRKY transcription factor 57 [Raphanus sativus]KAJ4865920.1 putative WRKY transcription factor 57 [Raphanus sativus]KAJ4884248.1 putative WRKY transcription factor 57 [Raphanus sativus]
MNDPKDPDLSNDSAWRELTASDSDFFYRDTSNILLSDFAWNLPASSGFTQTAVVPSSITTTTTSKTDQPIPPSSCSSSAAAASVTVTEVSTNFNNPSAATSSSSEDPTENSTASAAQTPETPKKEKKKAQKRIRQQRFAFMTKSDVDNLEDGYRWRKYGQKAVKNSQFPRSYYRCTNTRCTVKKRVERSSEDPSIVITTYEGQHCHQTVGFPRGGIFPAHEPHNFTSHHHLPPPLPNHYYYQELLHQIHRENTSLPQLPQSTTEDGHVAVSSINPSEEGLLGDIVPQTMRNP